MLIFSILKQNVYYPSKIKSIKYNEKNQIKYISENVANILRCKENTVRKNHKDSNTFSYVSNFICILSMKQKCAVFPSQSTQTEEVGDRGNLQWPLPQMTFFSIHSLLTIQDKT